MENTFLMNRRPRLIIIRSWREGRRDFIGKYGSYRNYIKSLDWQKKVDEFLKNSDGTCEWCGKEKKITGSS